MSILAKNVVFVIVLVACAALMMEVDVLDPATGGGAWTMGLLAMATIVFAVGGLRNHPIRTTKQVMIFIATFILIGILLNLGVVGGILLLTVVSVGMLCSAFATSPATNNGQNRYRNRACRILLAASGVIALAHISRVVVLLFFR